MLASYCTLTSSFCGVIRPSIFFASTVRIESPLTGPLLSILIFSTIFLSSSSYNYYSLCLLVGLFFNCYHSCSSSSRLLTLSTSYYFKNFLFLEVALSFRSLSLNIFLSLERGEIGLEVRGDVTATAALISRGFAMN